MYVYGHKRFTDDIERMTGAGLGCYPALHPPLLPRCEAGPLLAGHVALRLPRPHVCSHRLQHVLHADQHAHLLRVEQGQGDLWIFCLNVSEAVFVQSHMLHPTV
jgi:hypothetical protein